jgi:hypothetical protein
LPYALANDPAAFNDRLLAIDITAGGELSVPIQAAAYDDLMRDYYVLDQSGAKNPLDEDAA